MLKIWYKEMLSYRSGYPEEGDILIGRSFAQYRIIEKLGEGGMGVVYKAEHIKLRKSFALKFLRPEVIESRAHRARFVREARTAASLDHSAICPVYDFDEVDGQTYMAMAYIEGEDLGKRISEGPLPIGEAILLAIEVAEGIEAAHRQGIVHRDIKPSNIMITGAGHAKITDFGLVREEEATQITRSGTAVGTILYMSPEQTSGREVDLRTDIWSLGVVLYEMITGRRPFSGDHDLAIAHAIRSEDPLPARSLRPDTPPELSWILQKSLAKDTNDRYQTAGDMLKDLRALRDKLQSDRRRDRPSWVIPNRLRILLLSLALLAVAAAVLAYLFIWPRPIGQPGPAFGHPVQATSDAAWEGDPCLSPDGTRIAFVKKVAGNCDIHVIGTQGGRSLRLTDDPADDRDPAWLPDGSGIVFASVRDGQPGIWKVGQMGGGESLILTDGADPAVSPDGEWLAFSRVDSSGLGRIFIAPLDDPSRTRRLTGSSDGPDSHHYPAWSPDQQLICYATHHDLWLVPVTGDRRAGPLTKHGVADSYPAWSADGRFVFFSSQRENTLALWCVGADGNMLRRLTYGSGPESHPTLAGNDTRLAYTTSVENRDSDLWIFDRNRNQLLPLATGEYDDYQPCIAPDGSFVAFVSDRIGGKSDIWLQRLAGSRPAGDPIRLTDQTGHAAHPAVSPDGQFIAYYRIIDEKRHIWIVPVKGGRPRQITRHDAMDIHPDWSPDGKSLVFSSNRNGNYTIWTIVVESAGRETNPRQISPADLPAMFPVWSPDGQSIAFIGHREGRNFAYVMPADGSEKPIELQGVVDPYRVRWARNDGTLLISANYGKGSISIRRMVDPGLPLQDLEPQIVLGPAVEFGFFDVNASADVIVYNCANERGNIWVLTSVE